MSEGGLLHESCEQNGRRRRFYALTTEGRQVLERWRSEPTEQLYEARDPGALKLFFGADPGLLAPAQLAVHKRKLGDLRQIEGESPQLPQGMRLALAAGIGHEREFIRFWSQFAED